MYAHLPLSITPINQKLVFESLRCVLGNVDSAFAKWGVRYSISDGTLLGWKRNRKFIPWDDDADARVHADDWSKLKQYAHTLRQVDGGYTDGTLLWDRRLGTGAPDVQVVIITIRFLPLTSLFVAL
jgi:phosphorylcholine metabolism protein LicD